MNQSAIRTAPNAATAAPMYPKNKSPGKSNMRNTKVAIRARYETHKKDFRQLGTPMVCRHFGHANDNGRSRLWPRSSWVSISLHWKELLQSGHRGKFGRKCVKNILNDKSTTSTTRIGRAMCGGVTGI